MRKGNTLESSSLKEYPKATDSEHSQAKSQSQIHPYMVQTLFKIPSRMSSNEVKINTSKVRNWTNNMTKIWLIKIIDP